MLEFVVKKAEMNHLMDCKAALCNSKLGDEYFPSEKKAHNILREGIKKGEVYVAIGQEGECFGFIWFILEGAFHSFPFIHIIAVQEKLRGNGIGQGLLAFFENLVFPAYSKAFLFVADFNPEARRLYERLGYEKVGAIPDLYKAGVTEYLMMKKARASSLLSSK